MVDQIMQEKLERAKTKGLDALRTFLHVYEIAYFLEPITSNTLSSILTGKFKTLEEVRDYDKKIFSDRNVMLLIREDKKNPVQVKTIVESIFIEYIVKYKLYITLILFVISSCSMQRNIEVKSITSKSNEIIGWYNPKSKKIDAISLPFNLYIESSQQELLHTYQYKYRNPKKGASVEIYYINKEKKIEVLKDYEERSFSSNKRKKFLLYTRHMIYDTELSNKLSSKYIKGRETKDSITLGVFEDFYKNYPTLTKDLIKEDTLYLRFKLLPLRGKDKKIKRIKVPIHL
ncbi:hypothetical protein SAMN05444344_1976 [Tenacibaculum mesophilum]|uniref:Lipoprotein n=1 Tax=Tenacibaculum mesophilum TaxID=104268 RepID=A0ABN5T779_9FLAO|nr:hypothetical protein [Tenacibaculum mesophilum]AZJ32119.1 hypothetical protein D6200_05845 [Tenacibaculum mesophilum]QFS27379.1 hypothetical protein F9Y86_02715 [Tenacibaculum mesophilum]SHF90312.1 hypothetical protein SAMN05444344_1976 [Tenacibaculum mesophilum]